MSDHPHDHSHGRDPVDELAYTELSVRYGRLFGDLTYAQTQAQVLSRQNEMLRARVAELEAREPVAAPEPDNGLSIRSVEDELVEDDLPDAEPVDA